MEGIERQVEEKLQQMQDEGDTIRLQMEECVIEAERVIDDSQQDVEVEGDTGQSAVVPGDDDAALVPENTDAIALPEQNETGSQGNILQSQCENSESNVKFGVIAIQGNDDSTKFFTGLPSWAVFLHLFTFLSHFLGRFHSLSLEAQL